MKKITGILALAVLVLASCQKETSLDSGGNPGSGGGGTTGTGDLLVKVTTKTGADSTVTTYEYDASKRVVREVMNGVTGGQAYYNDLRLVRTASGIITEVIQKNDQMVAQGLDSVITKLTYDNASGRYTNRVSEISVFGFTITDSAVAVYDGSGKLIREDGYLISPLLGAGPALATKYDFTYDAAGNITEMKISSSDPTTGGPMTLQAIEKFTYDAKTSPLKLSIGEAFAMTSHTLASPNNPVKLDYQNAVTPAGNFSIDYTFTYTTKNKPATSKGTQTPGGAVSTITYFYK